MKSVGRAVSPMNNGLSSSEKISITSPSSVTRVTMYSTALSMRLDSPPRPKSSAIRLSNFWSAASLARSSAMVPVLPLAACLRVACSAVAPSPFCGSVSSEKILSPPKEPSPPPESEPGRCQGGRAGRNARKAPGGGAETDPPRLAQTPLQARCRRRSGKEDRGSGKCRETCR